MTLEDKDILQVDATVITGILILLTFSLIGPSSDDPTLVDIEVELTIRLALTVFMLMPFVISAIIILLKMKKMMIAFHIDRQGLQDR